MKPTTSTTKLHVVDIENLLGNPRPSVHEVRTCQRLWNDLTATTCPRQTIIACNHGAAPAVMFEWLGSAQRLLRSGANGADEALLEALSAREIASRFSEVVIGSGDHIFTDVGAWLSRKGLKVTVVSRRGSLARSLKMVAGRVIYFEPTDAVSLEVAA